MNQLKLFNPCDKGITSQPIFRASPNHLPCSSCGITSRQMGASKGPHSACLRCGQCDSEALLLTADRFIRWVKKSELAEFQNQGGHL